MSVTRPQWPHTLEDINASLDGVWGLVGAVGTSGNLFRLERSLHEPLIYTLIEFAGQDETKVVDKQTYNACEREVAVNKFAKALGF